MRCCPTTILLAAFVAPSLTTHVQGENALRYSPKVGAKLVYQVNITADLNGSVDRMKGTSYYTVKSVADGQVSLSFYGSVTSSKQATADIPRGPIGPRGPSFGRGPSFSRGRPTPTRGPRDLFETTPYKGLTTTNNELVITSRGEVQSLTGNSQLPYLLGNLSMLILEPLPEEVQKAWEVERGLVISEEKERESGPPRFGTPRFGPIGPRGPFAPVEKEKKLTAGSQVESYAIKSDDGKLVTIAKTYKAKSAETDDGSIEVSGSGTWVFNRELGVPDSLNFKQELVVSQKNISLKVPMTVSYRRLTDDELKKMAEERAKLAEENAKLAAERAKKREEAERKAKEEGRTIPERPSLLSGRNQPLTDADKKEILELLKGGSAHNVMQGYHKLQMKSPPTIDDEIKAAIRPLLKDENRVVQQIAGIMAKKWPLDSPAVATAGTTTPSGGVRKWTDASGTYSIEAEFLGLVDGQVRLKKKDGKEISVPLARLSESDQKAAQQLSEKTSNPSNPFE